MYYSPLFIECSSHHFLVCCVCASSEVQIIHVLELYVKCVLPDRVLGVALIRNTGTFGELLLFIILLNFCYVSILCSNCWGPSYGGFYLLVASVP